MKQLPLMPFGWNECVVPGEQKQIRLYEPRFHALFEAALKDHNGCMALGYGTEDGGLIQCVSIAEIKEYNSAIIPGSILATLLVRSTGRILRIRNEEKLPFAVLEVVEEEEEHPVNYDLLEMLVDKIEESVREVAVGVQKLQELSLGFDTSKEPITEEGLESMNDRLAHAKELSRRAEEAECDPSEEECVVVGSSDENVLSFFDNVKKAKEGNLMKYKVVVGGAYASDTDDGESNNFSR